MVHKLSDLIKKLTATLKGKGRDAHYVATCPICFYSHSVDVLSNETSAEEFAKQHIVGHLKAKHRDEIEDNTAKN